MSFLMRGYLGHCDIYITPPFNCLLTARRKKKQVGKVEDTLVGSFRSGFLVSRTFRGRLARNQLTRGQAVVLLLVVGLLIQSTYYQRPKARANRTLNSTQVALVYTMPTCT